MNFPTSVGGYFDTDSKFVTLYTFQVLEAVNLEMTVP